MSVFPLGGFAQGIVDFSNGPTTPAMYYPWDAYWNGGGGPISGPVGSWYFGLLISSSPAGPFVFSGVYATNTARAGRFSGGHNVSVPGWESGVIMSFEVAGWSASLGAGFNPQWLNQYPCGGLFAVSAIGTGAAGGPGQNGAPYPPLPLFGGTGIYPGMIFAEIPEPCCLAVAGLGLGAFLISRRRNQRLKDVSI